MKMDIKQNFPVWKNWNPEDSRSFFFFGILMPQTGGGFYQWMNVSKLNKTCEGHAVAAL